MTYKNILRLAIKNLLYNRSRTLVTISGMMIGIGAIVFLVSLGYGLQDLVKRQIADSDDLYNLDVTNGGSTTLKIDTEAIKKISELSNIEKVYTVISTGGKIRYNKTMTDGIINGINTEYLKNFKIKLSHGNLFSSDKANEIIVNPAACELLNIDPEDIVNRDLTIDLVLSATLVDNQKEKETISGLEYSVVGVTNDEDSATAYVPQNTLKAKNINYYSSLEVVAKDKNKIFETRKAIENMGFQVDYVGDTIEKIDEVFYIFKITLASFGLVATAVAALGMFNTITVSLLERIREIGLLKALGTKRKDIYKMFLTESLIMGISGGILGLILGIIGGWLLNLIINMVAVSTGSQVMNFFYTPYYFAIVIIGFAMIIGIVTGLYPAKKATKINPLDALRYE